MAAAWGPEKVPTSAGCNRHRIAFDLFQREWSGNPLQLNMKINPIMAVLMSAYVLASTAFISHEAGRRSGMESVTPLTITNESVRWRTEYVNRQPPPVTNSQGLVRVSVTDAFLIGGSGSTLDLIGTNGQIFTTPNGPLMFRYLLIYAKPVGQMLFPIEPAVVQRPLWETNAHGLVWRTNRFGYFEPATSLVSNWFGDLPPSRRISNWDEWARSDNSIRRSVAEHVISNFHVIPITNLW